MKSSEAIYRLAKNNNGEFIKSSIDYNVVMLREALEELSARDKYLYYKYEPASKKHYEMNRCLADGVRIIIADGAARSGKTTTSLMNMVMLALGEHPFAKIEAPNNWWIVTSNFKKVYETGGMLDKLKEVLPMNRVAKIDEDNKRNNFKIILDNGSQFYFKSQEEGVDSYTSVKIHGFLADERIHDQRIRTQLRARIVDKEGFAFFTMDKIEGDDWIADMKKLDYARHFNFIMEDNKFIKASEIERLKQEFDDIDREQVLYGNFKERNVLHLFKPEIWNESNFIEIKPSRLEYVMDEFQPNESGALRLFKEPEQGVRYVVGVDTAEGIGRNSHCIQVVSEFGEQVANWFSNTLHYTELDRVVSAIGNYYNKAIVIVEAKTFGFAVLMKLKDTYPSLYYERKRQSLTKADYNLKYGIGTERDNKTEMVTSLSSNIEKSRVLIHCSKTKAQLGRFVKDEKGFFRGLKDNTDPELKNNDDDLVMAIMFANKVLVDWNLLKFKRHEQNFKYQEDERKKIFIVGKNGYHTVKYIS